jgi:twinkle protein
MKKKEVEYEESVVLYKTSCSASGCGSSDANAVYANGGSHCFSCGTHVFPDKRTNKNSGKIMNESDEEINELESSWVPELTTPTGLLQVDVKPLDARRINLETVTKFNYGYANGKQVATYYDTAGNPVAQKLRAKDKTFSWIGEPKKATLYGQQLWTPHPKKRIVITEGEIDALSVSQIQENKWAVVSIPSGVDGGPKAIRRSLEWLSGFKEVVFCFDNDAVGIAAAKECASLLPPNKAFICTLPLKDANEMLKAGRVADLVQCLWDAKKFKPDGILNGTEILDRLNQSEPDTSYAFPEWIGEVNKKTKGIRLGELDVFTSGTGSGKTTLMKQLQMHYFHTTDLNQGLMMLEEPLKNTANGLIGIDLQKRLHMEFVDKEVIDAKARDIFLAQDSEGFNRFNLYDAFGSVAEEELYNKIRFMVNGLGCKIIWLDHLSILVSSLGQDGDERRAIDNIMHNLKSLTIELKCYIGLIVHLNNDTKGQGKTFEEGAIPNLNNLRGSGGIKQLSDTVYAFSRNQQDENEVIRNTSLITVLKCRYTGSTGRADYVYFNNDTGCLQAGVNPELAATFADVKTDF